MRIGGGCGFKNVQPNFVRGTFYIEKIDEYCTPFPKTLENAFSKDHKTSLAAEEMQLICPTSEFKVGHLGMIQQERQNNIINILGGHSYAM